MSSSSRHHEEADRLLKLAGIEKNHISRGLILAEAQVHALLALDAATGTSPAATPPELPDNPGIVPTMPRDD